jgi:hypothetical protein
LIDYQLHQFRLIPRFARVIVTKFSVDELEEMWMKIANNIIDADPKSLTFFHAVSAFQKSYFTKLAQDDLMEAR